MATRANDEQFGRKRSGPQAASRSIRSARIVTGKFTTAITASASETS